ncbi:MAG: hypothetical protein IJ650_01735 [Paludibacteraceae bacterium]|nr:hypothetical protein [Paludibacteraceae bacterium]
MDPKAFIKEIPLIADKCFEEDAIPNAMNTYGSPIMKEDGAHVKALEYPLWGIFKYCYNAAALDSNMPQNMAFFFPDKLFMFYDELSPLAVITSLLLPESQRKSHIEHYIQSFIENKSIENIAFEIITAKYRYNCFLTTFEGLPALQVSYEII